MWNRWAPGRGREKSCITPSSLFTIYVPVNARVFMRPILTRQQAEELVRQIPSIREDICLSRRPSELKNHYETCLQRHDCHDLVQLMKGVYVKTRRAEDDGRRPGQVDARYGKRAEERDRVKHSV